MTAAVPAAPANAGPHGPNPGSIGIGLLDIPLSRVNDPRARMYIVDHVKPGTTIRRRVKVTNSSAHRHRIALYTTAASVLDNTFTPAAGRTPNELTSWTHLPTSSVDLAPWQVKRVPVTITVPRRASRGERYAAIFASLAATHHSRRNPATKVVEINRIGIRIYLDIGRGGEPPTHFRIDGIALHHAPGHGHPHGRWPYLSARVHNTGERALDMTGKLSLARVHGTTTVGPFQVQNGVTILPRHSGQVRAVLNEPLAAGRWLAHLDLSSGVVHRAVNKVITLDEPTGVTIKADAGSGQLGAVLLPGAIVTLAAVLAVLLWYRIRRTRLSAALPKKSRPKKK